MFDYLVGTTPDGQPTQQGGLASKWENSADHKRWTFHLRKGVKFHTGDEMTSEDVKFSLQRAMSKRSTTGYAGPLRTLIQDIETPAPDRVVIVTKESTLIIPIYLSRALSTEGMVLPKKYLEANGDDVFARKPVGTGPYKFVEQVVGSHIKLTAVDSHWRIGMPKYKNITFKLVPEETTRIALLRRGEVDVTDVSRERVKELEKEGFPIHLRKDEALVHMWFVLSPDGWVAPMKDKRVREALNLAIDRNEIAQSIFGGRAEPAAIPFGLSWSFKDIGFKVTPEMAYPYDPARAKKLLADAGHPNGFALDMYAFQLPGFPEGKAFAEAISGYWEKIGVKPKLIPVDYPGVPQAVGRPQGARGGGLLQHRQPRLDRHLRAPREAGLHAVQAQRYRQRPRDRRHDRAGHEPDRPDEDQLAHAEHLHAPAERALRGAGGLHALALRRLEEARQVEPRQRHVRPLHRRAGVDRK